MYNIFIILIGVPDYSSSITPGIYIGIPSFCTCTRYSYIDARSILFVGGGGIASSSLKKTYVLVYYIGIPNTPGILYRNTKT